MSAKRSVREENTLLFVERLAILTVLRNVFEQHGVPEEERDERIALACVSLGAEVWGRMHADLSQDECASIYGDIAQEALRGWHDTNVFTFATSAAKKECPNA
jgi:hypothetical protein